MFLSYYQTLIIPHSEIYKLSKFKGIRDLCNLLIKKITLHKRNVLLKLQYKI